MKKLRVGILSGILVMAVLIFSGCASVPKTKPTGLNADVFWTDQAKRREQTKQLSAKIRLRYRSKKESVAGTGRLVSQAPNQLRLELRDPFGKLHYLVTLRGNEFAAEYPSQHLAYLDKNAGNSYLKRALGLSVSFTELQSFLVGAVPESFRAEASKFNSWEWDEELSAYRGTLNSGSRKLTCWVDPQKGTLRSALLQSGDDKVAVTYTDFAPCCRTADDRGNGGGLSLAQVVDVQVKGGGTGVELEWEDIVAFEGTKPAQLFQSSLPQGMKRIVLD